MSTSPTSTPPSSSTPSGPQGLQSRVRALLVSLMMACNPSGEHDPVTDNPPKSGPSHLVADGEKVATPPSSSEKILNESEKQVLLDRLVRLLDPNKEGYHFSSSRYMPGIKTLIQKAIGRLTIAQLDDFTRFALLKAQKFEAENPTHPDYHFSARETAAFIAVNRLLRKDRMMAFKILEETALNGQGELKRTALESLADYQWSALDVDFNPLFKLAEDILSDQSVDPRQQRAAARIFMKNASVEQMIEMMGRMNVTIDPAVYQGLSSLSPNQQFTLEELAALESAKEHPNPSVRAMASSILENVALQR